MEPAESRGRTQGEVPMFSYRCPNCGALAYSSANAVTVGPCPHCAQTLLPHAEVPAPALARHDGLLRPLHVERHRKAASR